MRACAILNLAEAIEFLVTGQTARRILQFTPQRAYRASLRKRSSKVIPLSRRQMSPAQHELSSKIKRAFPSGNLARLAFARV